MQGGKGGDEKKMTAESPRHRNPDRGAREGIPERVLEEVPGRVRGGSGQSVSMCLSWEHIPCVWGPGTVHRRVPSITDQGAGSHAGGFLRCVGRSGTVRGGPEGGPWNGSSWVDDGAMKAHQSVPALPPYPPRP